MGRSANSKAGKRKTANVSEMHTDSDYWNHKAHQEWGWEITVLCAVPRSSQFILRPLESLQQDKRGKKRVTWSCNFFLKPALVTHTRECIRGDRGKLVFVCLYKHGAQASKTSLHVPVQYSGMVIRSAWSQTVSGSSSSRAMF